MIRRLFLVLAAAAFIAWIGWLAYAVSKSGTVPIVSRAQLTEATHLLVVELTLAPDGPPLTKVKVVGVISGEGIKPGTEIEIDNLRSAKVLAGKDRIRPEEGKDYFLPVVLSGGRYRVAGLPDSPGYKDLKTDFPVIYPWTDEVQVQLRSLKLLK
jgi:hypothetical protein